MEGKISKMICRLFEFLANNDLGLDNPHVFESSSDCNINQCSNSDHSKDLDIKLCDVRWGWFIDRWIKFPKDFLSDLSFSNCDVGIRLNHPIRAHIWICRKIGETPSYVISSGSQRTECKNIKQVNYELKKMCDDFGRDLTEKDLDHGNN